MSDSDNDDNDDNNEKKKDITRIEDLSEFFHEEDPESEAHLEEGQSEEGEEEKHQETQDISDLPDLPAEESQQQAESEEDEDKEEEHNPEEDTEEFNFNTDDDFSSPPEQEEDNENNSESPFDEGVSFGEQDEQGEQYDNSSFELEEGNDWELSSSENESSAEENQPDGFDLETNTLQTDDDNSDEPPEEDHAPERPETEQPQPEDKKEENDNILQFDEGQEQEHQEEEDLKREGDIREEKEQAGARPERENFQDVREFGTHMTYGHVGAGGNPPYSVVLRNIQYEEDAEDILSLLGEHGILNEQNEKQMRQSVEMGALLISQISEYAAIYLAHRLRRFSLDMQIGLSEDIHPPKSYRNTEVGLSSKKNLQKNRTEHLKLSDKNLSIEDIVASTSEKLPEWDVLSHLGIITEHSLLKESDLNPPPQASEDVEQGWAQVTTIESEEEEGEGSPLSQIMEIQDNSPVLDHIYQDLINKLKKKALGNHANGILNISFQLTPLKRKASDRELSYKVTCTGNLVQLQKRE